MLCTIMYIAIPIINADTVPPRSPSINLRDKRSIVPSSKVVSIVDVSVIIDTQAAAILMAFDAENTGLLYLLYFTILTIATVKAVNVYAAIAMVVIS